MKFSVVIPTYNREEDLNKCLDSILKQTVLPFEVIIIDDGSLPEIFISAWQEKFTIKDISLVYYRKNHEIERRGLSESKNKALELVCNEIFFILDDDVVLELNFCENIINIWIERQADKNLIGVGGIIKNRRMRSSLERVFHSFFGISSKHAWDVNKIGFQIWDEEIKKPSLGFYAHGGVCSYKLELAKELKFSTFSGGRTALEDVDFCLRAKNKGLYFIIEPQAELYHYPKMVVREGKFLIGYKESYNRKVIFKSVNKKPSLFLLAWFGWASFGWVLRQFLVGNFSKGMGMIKGYFS
jgi:GT2 family glycosyltransferase